MAATAGRQRAAGRAGAAARARPLSAGARSPPKQPGHPRSAAARPSRPRPPTPRCTYQLTAARPAYPTPSKPGYRVGGGLKRGWGRASGVGGVGSGPGLSRRGEGVTPVGPSSGFPTSPPRARPVRRRTSSLPLLRHHSTTCSRRFPLGSVTLASK